MNNYVLIVEDEEIVRRNMCNIVDWKSLGFEDVYEAENGQDAYILALQLQPRLILTDIRMPIMDGLELVSKIRLELPNCMTVIISGHDDFSYAQKAITLGASDYILKPIGAKTLTSRIKEILKNNEERYNQIFELEQAKKQLFESLPIVQENLLTKLVCTLGEKSDLSDKINFWKVPISSPPFIVAIIEPDFTSFDSCEQEIYLYSMKKMVCEILGNKHTAFVNKDERITVIFSIEENEDIYMLREYISSSIKVVQYSLKSYLKVESTIALGSKCTSLSTLCESYQNALTALENKYILGNHKIYDFYDLPSNSHSFCYPQDKIADFQLAVKSCDSAKLPIILKDIFFGESSASITSTLPISIIAGEMIVFLLKTISNIPDIPEALYEEGTKIFNKLNHYAHTSEVSQSILQYSTTVIEQLSNTKIKNSSLIVDQAIDYVDENYFKSDLSLSSVAKEISVSSGYLSILFKKEKGFNFSDYVNKVRMEKSIHLLRTTRLTTYQIAEEIGFNNSHYFSLCFKKYTGISPSEYRENSSEDSYEKAKIR
ncbi:MAG: Response regulator containing CheY-like receiver domain and AraC-type DNA-binding domain [Clostridia bacterium]|jgi:two-component system response regulator YesN|nr:Response regulator containing CheY-like receiver domain and AraC-type DNA-binding domain [Clostridia bacterium]